MTTLDKQAISSCVWKFYKKSKQLYPFALVNWDAPTFSFNLRGTVGGRAYLRENKMTFQPVLFEQNKKDYFDNIIPHEVAHLVAWRVYGDNGHGAGWKRVMRDLGLVPTRCHSFDVSTVKQNYTIRRALYTCPCKKEFELSIQKHRSKKSFICVACKNPIKFTGTIIQK